MAEELLESGDSINLLSATLKLLTKEPSTAPVNITDESPHRSRQQRGDRFERSSYNRNRDPKYSPRMPKRDNKYPRS